MESKLILSVGMPRAGSGWFYNLTQDLVLASGGIDARSIRSKYSLNKLLTEVNCNIGTLTFYRLVPVSIPSLFEPPYVIKLHAGRRPLADMLIRANWIKPTFIYRDPRDALLSAFEYGQRMVDAGQQNAFSHIQSINEGIDFIYPYIDFARGWISSPQTLSVRYEDLLLDYSGQVKRLCSHLDIDPDHPSIQELIENYHPESKSKRHTGTHFVKGKIGRHRDRFSEDELDRCQELFGDFLSEFGYQD